MTSAMKDAQGYDTFGNCSKLLCAHDRLHMRRGIPRATGTVICSVCGCTYNLHPAVQGALWATRTCDTGIVKL